MGNVSDIYGHMIQAPETAPAQKIYTRQFMLLCLSSFLFFVSFNMIIPELPDYLEAMGGGQYKGLIIALFTLTAMLSRPFSGKLTDKIGRIPVMVVGAAVCCVTGLLYPFAQAMMAFFALRLLHGFSTGFKPTGTSAYVADVVPPARRGEALGVLGMSGSGVGMAIAPTLGSWVANAYGLQAMFYVSAFTAILSVLILLGMEETLKDKVRFSFSLLKIKREDLFEPRVLHPSLNLALMVFCFGVVLTIIPDFSKELGMENKGFYFTVVTVTSVGVRFFAGKASDRWGRIPVLILSSVLLIAAMIVTGLATNVPLFFTGGLLYGLAVGMNYPSFYAWVIDWSDPAKLGKGVATMFIFLEIGIGLGALTSGFIYGNQAARIPITFFMAAAAAAVSMVYLIILQRHLRNNPVEQPYS